MTDAGTTDAGADAAVALVPFSGQLVALGVGADMQLVRMKDDGLVVASGPAVWTVAKNGQLARVGTPADAVPLLREGDDEMSGYDVRTILLNDSSVSGPATMPFVHPSESVAFQWNGKAWVKAGGAPAPEYQPRYSFKYEPAEFADLPKGWYWKERRVMSNAVVWLGYKPQPDPEARSVDEAVLLPAGTHVAHTIPFPQEHAAPTKYRSCELIESADEHAYATCTSSTNLNDYEHRSYVLEGEQWGPAKWKIPDHGVRAIDAEGALWTEGSSGLPPTLLRTTVDWKEERFDLPTVPANLTAPGYRSQEIPIDTGGEIRHWVATTIVDAPEIKEMTFINEIIPRRSGEVWVAARETSSEAGGSILVRYARGAGSAPAPTLVRTSGDEHNAVQEGRGVRSWAGRCASAFIPFPRASATFYTEHKAEIDRIVATTDSKKGDVFDIAIVDGQLGGHHVAGILLIRSDPAADDKRLAKAVEKLTELATPNPASPPAVSCTLPELEHVVEHLRTAHPSAY